MFLYRLEDADPYSTQNVKGGTFQSVHKDVFPALEGMAIHRLSMEPGTLNPPHWHPNSHEIVYVLSGTALFGIRGVGDDADDNGTPFTFKATRGDVVFIEQNYSHWFKSIGAENLEVGVWFNSESPTTVGLVSSLRGVPDPEVAQAFGVSTPTVTGINTDTVNLLAGEVSAEELGGFNGDSEFKRNMFTDAEVSFDEPGVGKVSKITSKVFPKMKDFTLAHISVEPGAMRQIHWHRYPNELNLILSGEAEFGIVTPEDESFVYPVRYNDVIMAPLGYSHYAVNKWDETFEFALGFDHENIDGIDVRQVLGHMEPSSVRKQTLKIDPSRIAKLRTDSASIVPSVAPIVRIPK